MTAFRIVFAVLLTSSLLACAGGPPRSAASASVPAVAPVSSGPAAPSAAAVSPAVPGVPAAARRAPPNPQVLGKWIIEQARSAPLLDKRFARLDFGADGALVGHASCNSFSGRYTLAAEQIKIDPLTTTRKACGDAQMEQEDRVLTALERAARATVPPHGFLTLLDADGAVLMRASRPETAN